MGFITVNEKDWEASSSKQREWMTYNTLQSIDERLKKLEKKPLVTNFYSLLGGILGGMLATLGLKRI